MPDESITQEEINDLLAKLEGLPDLTVNQSALLAAMIRMVAELEEVTIEDDPPAFRPEFGEAFSPGKASLAINYAAEKASGQSFSESAGSALRSQIARYVTK